MMEEAEDHPEVLQAQDPNIATQLQDAAQTNVLAGNGSSPALNKVPSLIQAPTPLPAFANINSPSATIPTTITVASTPTSKIPSLSSPATASQFTTPSSVPSASTPPPVPSVVTSVPTTTAQVTAPGQLQTPQEASSTVPVTTDGQTDVPGSPGGGGLLGWGRGVMNKIAEKTKSSVETVITTLDPGMKELILSGGDIDVVVTSTKENKVCPVRDAFQEVFGKATITGQESSANTAAQPVGFTAGLKGAEERIQNLRHSGAIHEKQPVLSVEGFVAELLPDRWYELSCIVLQDPGNNIDLQTFSQATLVPPAIIQRMQDGTASDYPLRWSGLAVTVGQAVEETFPHIKRTNWQEALTSVKRKETLYLAVKSIAEMYRQRLPASQLSS